MSNATNSMMTEALQTKKGTTKKQATEAAKNRAEALRKDHTKSATIRKMHEEGFERADIARALQIRYQHVRNVLVQPLKKAK